MISPVGPRSNTALTVRCLSKRNDSGAPISRLALEKFHQRKRTFAARLASSAKHWGTVENRAPGLTSFEPLDGAVEKITERRGGKERLGSGPARNVERARWMGARRSGVADVMGAEDMLNEAVVDFMAGLHALFGIDEKTLTTDGTANVRRKPRRLA
jgi:hypothetical protein